MERMKKGIVVFGAVAIALLMVSSVTAVDQTNSSKVVNFVESQKVARNSFSNNDWLQVLDFEEMATVDLQGIIDLITEAYQSVLGEQCQIDLENNQELAQLIMDMSTMQEYSTTEVVNNILNNDFIVGLVEIICDAQLV